MADENKNLDEKLKNDQTEAPGIREIIEKKIYFFIRYFLPSIIPLIIYVGVVAICLIVGAFVFNFGKPLEQYMQEMTNLYAIIGVCITFRILRKRSQKEGSGFFEDASLYIHDINIKKVFLCIGFGIGSALALSAFISLLPSIGVIAEYESHVDKIYQRWSVFLSMMFSTFFTPLVEEVIFRGYMLNGLLPHWSEKKALLVVSLTFAFMHGTSIWILYAFVMGMILGKVSILEDNIFYSVVMHMSFNLPSTVLWLIYLRIPGSKESLSANPFMILLMGLAGGVVAWGCYIIYKRSRKHEIPITFK
ncbi:MAG: CPBP family intramembrane metalloprotease [Lachnospiraceae bacterium]|nr:CPBP family intramembrane metalloprotease [Lachnospiraceae bacterium]